MPIKSDRLLHIFQRSKSLLGPLKWRLADQLKSCAGKHSNVVVRSAEAVGRHENTIGYVGMTELTLSKLVRVYRRGRNTNEFVISITVPLSAIMCWNILDSQHLAVHPEVPSRVTRASLIFFVSFDTAIARTISWLRPFASGRDHLLEHSRFPAPTHIRMIELIQSELHHVYRHG